MKKKPYHVPNLKVHGSVEDITNAFGNERFQDSIFDSTASTIHDNGLGSRDDYIEPQNGDN